MSVAPSAESIPVLAVENVTKAYPGVRALNRVSFDLRRGEVHALIGENGAGKSTLIRLLSGDARPDEGTIRLHGKEIRFASPRDARRSGIVAIFQELMIVGELSVAENVFVGSEPGLGGILHGARPNSELQRCCTNSLAISTSIRVGKRRISPRHRSRSSRSRGPSFGERRC
jgi:ABC-type sugar transport system ATPase subunit